MTTYNGPRQLREQKDFDRLTAELVRAQPPTKRSVIRWREDVPVPLDSIVIVFTPVAGGSLVLPRPESRDDGRTVIVAVAEGSGPLTVECPRPEEAAERKELVQPGAYTFYAIDRVYYVDTAIVGSVPAEAVAAVLQADGTSVLGKFDAGTGDVAPIVATSNFTVLTREADELTFDKVRSGHLNTASDIASVGFDFVWAGVNGGDQFYRLAADFGDGDVYVSGGVLRIDSAAIDVQPSTKAWTSSTTWVVPDGVTGGWLVGCGGGGQGGGGARPDNGSNTIAGGGGGGGGGAEEHIQWVDLTPGETCTITIGAGGSAAGGGATSDATAGTAGSDGGNTTFACAAGTFTFLGARGGRGGTWSSATAYRGPGGRASTGFGAILADTGAIAGFEAYLVSEPGSGGAGGQTGSTSQESGGTGNTNRRNNAGGSGGSTGADNTGCGGSGGGGGGGGPHGVGANGGAGGAGAAGGTASTGTGGSNASSNTGAGGGGGGAGGNSSGTSGNGGNGGKGGSGHLLIVHW